MLGGQEDAASFVKLGDAEGRRLDSSPVIGVRLTKQLPEALLDQRPRGAPRSRTLPGFQPEHTTGPRDRIPVGIKRPRVTGPDPHEVGDQTVVDLSRPTHRLTDRGHQPAARPADHPAHGIDRRQHVLGRHPPVVELETKLIAIGYQAVMAALQSYAIRLQTVAEAGLGYPLTDLDLLGQGVQLIEVVRRQLGHVGRYHSTYEQPT